MSLPKTFRKCVKINHTSLSIRASFQERALTSKELCQNKLHIFQAFLRTKAPASLFYVRKRKKSAGDQVENRQICLTYFDTISKFNASIIL